MTELAIAALQMAMTDDFDDNIATAERLVRDAARQGARVILIPELFEGPYFCKDQLPEHLAGGVLPAGEGRDHGPPHQLVGLGDREIGRAHV